VASRFNKQTPGNQFVKFVIGLICFFAILVACGYGINTYASSPKFCVSCHEMKPEYVSHTVSAHKEISCVKCHEKPGFKNIIANKVNLVKEVKAHFNGTPEQIVQTKERAVSNENCLQCHTKTKLVKATGDLIVNHPGHVEKGIPCITCHEGIAHTKMAERGINTAKDRDNWTKTNAKKLIEPKYVRPNMGSCIDCHDKVNKGEKPWNDMSYVMQQMPQKMFASIIAPGLEDVITENKQDLDQKTQKLILQAISDQNKNVKVSMECKTCHKIVNIPSVHKNADWAVNHGSMATQDLDKCLDCHQDSKWIREVPKENTTDLIKKVDQQNHYTPNYSLVKEQSRKNKFCSTCHSSAPPSHTQGNWSTDHVLASDEEKEKSNCYICHDKETPKETDVKAPAEACQTCHKNF
jgi:nitrate/TMAO reductase-like tetraheme cytochrome c subunit